MPARVGMGSGGLGLSLIELLVVIAIAAVLFSLGLPSLRTMIDSNRIAGEASNLQGDLRMARAEAVRRGAPVALCVSNDGAACASAGTWSSGWIVFSNRAGDGVLNAGNGDTVLRVQPAWSGTDLVATTPAVLGMAFNAEGFSANVRGNTTITIAPVLSNASIRRCLMINLAGTVSSQVGAACP